MAWCLLKLYLESAIAKTYLISSGFFGRGRRKNGTQNKGARWNLWEKGKQRVGKHKDREHSWLFPKTLGKMFFWSFCAFKLVKSTIEYKNSGLAVSKFILCNAMPFNNSVWVFRDGFKEKKKKLDMTWKTFNRVKR